MIMDATSYTAALEHEAYHHAKQTHMQLEHTAPMWIMGCFSVFHTHTHPTRLYPAFGHAILVVGIGPWRMPLPDLTVGAFREPEIPRPRFRPCLGAVPPRAYIYIIW